MKSTHSFSGSYYKNLWIILTLNLLWDVLWTVCGCSRNPVMVQGNPTSYLYDEWIAVIGDHNSLSYYFSLITELTVWLQGIWVMGKHATFCSWCKANIFFMFIFPLCLYVTDLTLHEATCDILLKCIHEISKLITQPSLFKEISMQPIMCSFVLALHNITACSNMTKCKANRTKVAQHSLKSFYFNCFNVPSVHLIWCAIITESN